jgi:hypothetical protein
MAAVLSHESHRASSDPLAALLTRRGPSQEGLLAWHWARQIVPPMVVKAAEVCRMSRLRETGGVLRDAGAERLWLWGAGRHTGWLLDHRADVGLPIAGIVDDALAGEHRHGFAVSAPSALCAGEHVLISSDAFEEAIWEASAPLRQRGVHVHRLYSAA